MFCRLPNKSCWILEICPPPAPAPNFHVWNEGQLFLFLPNRYKAAFGNHGESHLCSAIDLWIIAFWPEGLNKTAQASDRQTPRGHCSLHMRVLPYCHTLSLLLGWENHKYGHGLWTMYDVYVKPRPDNVWIMQDGFYSAIRASEKLYRNPPTRCIEVCLCCNTECCWYQPW